MTRRRHVRERTRRNRQKHLPPAHRLFAYNMARFARRCSNSLAVTAARIFSVTSPLMQGAHWMLPPDVDANDETFTACAARDPAVS